MDRWAADLIDYNARPSHDPNGGDPYQYILIVQDIFSRKLWAHALKTKSQEVVQQAFESIVRRAGTPDNLDTDNGHEFRVVFRNTWWRRTSSMTWPILELRTPEPP